MTSVGDHPADGIGGGHGGFPEPLGHATGGGSEAGGDYGDLKEDPEHGTETDESRAGVKRAGKLLVAPQVQAMRLSSWKT